jgi:high-affinity iron transporter
MPGRILARPVLVCGIVAVVLLGVAIAIIVAPQSTDTASSTSGSSITITDFACADGWVPPRSGQRELIVDNAGSSVADIALVGAGNSLVYGEVEAMAPGTTRTMTVIVPPGRYRVQCTFSEGATLLSGVVTISGRPVTGAHAYLPVTYSEALPAITAYRADVSAGLATLATDTDHLRSLADAGQLEQAKSAWLVAHLDYERLGAAYDTFGDFNDEIDGRPNGLPLGVHDPHWTGFLRLEAALWQDQPAATVAFVANLLDDDVHGLVAAFPDQTIDPNDLSLRTHEILENTLQFQLTGETDEGSHTGLATALANVEGTEMTLTAIAPLLARRAPALLATATAGLHRLATLFASFQQPDGTWTPVQALSAVQREVVDGTIGSLLETLSPIPDILEIPPDSDHP